MVTMGTAIMAATAIIDRRRLLGLLSLPAMAGLAGPALALTGVLKARPLPGPFGEPVAAGVMRLGELGVLYVPPSLRRDGPAPLLLTLHGAGQGAEAMVARMQGLADALGLVLLAPDSTGKTWDWLDPVRQQSGSRPLEPGAGPDTGRIDRALAAAFALMAFDRLRVGLMGFSDGATYGLDLGIRNPDLFTHLFIAAPGGLPKIARGPGVPIYIAHGTQDRVLAEKVTARMTVPDLRRRGFDVTYETFAGGHQIEMNLMQAAIAGWLSRAA